MRGQSAVEGSRKTEEGTKFVGSAQALADEERGRNLRIVQSALETFW